ncbi:MAG: hypothetical protein FJ276_01655 [Planctomycetes bacterium]|nr:hypothetical protein [Planctomycetota bacterium]
MGAIIDELCDKFEAAWQCGDKPRIEDYLAQAPADKSDALLNELLAIEVSYRRHNAETARQEEYVDRFPSQADLVRRVFTRLDATEKSEATQRADERAEHIGQVISASARYSQLEFHDEGGLGEVYRAKDEELRRSVAIKFLHREHVLNNEMLARFRIEGEVTGRLDHPSVVPVYAMGEGWDGRPFYVMRFIEGENLGQAIDDFWQTDWSTSPRSAWRMELHRLLEHLIAACNAVAYAHNRGVLHRDIKPANIMLGKYGETLVVDWGLAQFIARDERAKASGEETLMPGLAMKDSHAGAGTIGYVSPEQLPGSAEPISAACDVYSLGATLYKLVTGVTAFHRGQGRSVWNRIREGDFRKPRELNKNCPPALEAICLKAMALRPADRYASALDLAEDLRRWMADESVAVYREPLFARLLRSARRHRAWTFAAVCLAVIVLLMTSLLAAMFHRTSKTTQAAMAVVQEAKIENLRLSAFLAASNYGHGIDRRWRALTELAADPQLAQLIKATAGKDVVSPEFQALDDWLDRRISGMELSIPVESWFVNDDQGRQVARHPFSSKSVGKNFRGRSYFHGGLKMLDDAAANDAKPIQQPCLSAVYRSTTTGVLKVACSVPVWEDRDGNRTGPIGVLGMSVVIHELNQFEKKTDQIAMALVDVREDWLEEKPQHGLILDHPRLVEAAEREDTEFVRVAPELLERLHKLRRSRFRDRNRQLPIEPITLLNSVGDAACEPIFVPGRNGDLEDSGWVVIVQDRRAPDGEAATR